MAVRLACERLATQADVELVGKCRLETVPVEDIEEALDAASDALQQLAQGWTLGRCEVTLRPCRERCIGNPCGCCVTRGVKIPGLSPTITSVTISGEVVDENTYALITQPNGDLWLERFTLAGERAHWPNCFPAGTLVTTARGQVPIEEVVVGDLALTHRGRWMKVKAAWCSGVSDTVVVRGQGGTLRCTGDHRVMSSEIHKVGDKTKLGTWEWMAATSLVGSAWASPRGVEALPMKFEGHDRDFWVMVGLYISDGYASQRTPKGWLQRALHIKVSKGRKRDFLDAYIQENPGWRTTESGGTKDYVWANPEMWGAFMTEFGHGARSKVIPSWVLSADENVREAVLEGILLGDGYQDDDACWVTTTSKPLAISLGLLLSSMGICATPHEKDNEHGRYWAVTWSKAPKKMFYWPGDDAVWSRVKSVEIDEESVAVYDIEVEEDHSFVADGRIVHNCQQVHLAPTEPDTFAITYEHGLAVDMLMRWAVAEIAIDTLSPFIARQNSLEALPDGVASFDAYNTRVTMNRPVANSERDDPDRLVGLGYVRRFLAAYPPQTGNCTIWAPETSDGRIHYMNG